MTTQRTPKRRKIWTRETIVDQRAESASSPAIHDLLSAYKTDAGVNSVEGVTVVRMNIRQWEFNVSDSSRVGTVTASHGIGWVTDEVAALADGSSAIPDPISTGFRKTRYLHRWDKAFQILSNTDKILENDRGNPTYFQDTMQMGKCPGGNYTLALMSSDSPDNTTASIVWTTVTIVDTMLALP